MNKKINEKLAKIVANMGRYTKEKKAMKELCEYGISWSTDADHLLRYHKIPHAVSRERGHTYTIIKQKYDNKRLNDLLKEANEWTGDQFGLPIPQEVYDEEARNAVEWVTDEYKDDPEGRYYLNIYHGCGVYELIFKDDKIVGGIHEGFYYNTPYRAVYPYNDGYGHIERGDREQFIEAVEKYVTEIIGEHVIKKCYGSCCEFYEGRSTTPIK